MAPHREPRPPGAPPRRRAGPVRPSLPASLAVAVLVGSLSTTAACSNPLDADGRNLQLSGRVTDAVSGAGVPSARLAVFSIELYSGSREVLGRATADAEGRYALTASPPPGYVGANCSVMDVAVAAQGYVSTELRLAWQVQDVDRCTRGGSARADFALYPAEGDDATP